jgi:hypothetical protein
MHPIAASAVKLLSGGTTAAMLTLGLTTGLADASTTAPTPTSDTAATAGALAGVRDAVRFAVFEAEAAVLRIPPKAFRADLERGITVQRLARERGLNKEQFGDRLVVNLKPRLAQLVHLRVITKSQADMVIDRIEAGHIPWWDGLHKAS